MTAKHSDTDKPEAFVVGVCCDQKMNHPKEGSEKWDKCMCQQLCAKIKKLDDARKKGKPPMKKMPDREDADYDTYKNIFKKNFMDKVKAGKGVKRQFMHKCAADKYMEDIYPDDPTKNRGEPPKSPFNADHVHESQLGCNLKDLKNFKMLDTRVNATISFERYEPEGKHDGKPIKAEDSCNCPHGPID